MQASVEATCVGEDEGINTLIVHEAMSAAEPGVRVGATHGEGGC